jgi:hypothetical protein
MEHDHVERSGDRRNGDLLDTWLARRVNEEHGWAAATTLGCNNETANRFAYPDRCRHGGNYISFPAGERARRHPSRLPVMERVGKCRGRREFSTISGERQFDYCVTPLCHSGNHEVRRGAQPGWAGGGSRCRLC